MSVYYTMFYEGYGTFIISYEKLMKYKYEGMKFMKHDKQNHKVSECLYVKGEIKILQTWEIK